MAVQGAAALSMNRLGGYILLKDQTGYRRRVGVSASQRPIGEGRGMTFLCEAELMEEYGRRHPYVERL
jgi:hypothetical protein